MHNCFDEFDFRQDSTTDYGVSCPLASDKSMYNPLFLIESSSFVQVIRTTTISRTSSKFGTIQISIDLHINKVISERFQSHFF